MGDNLGEKSADKAERVLSMYTRLKAGKVITKKQESMTYGVSERTIQRDIDDLRYFLANQNLETEEYGEIVYDYDAEGYILKSAATKVLGSKEALVIGKILLESRALVKAELFPMLDSLSEHCKDEDDKKILKELMRNEMFHYVELHHGKKLVDDIWELEQAVKEQKYIFVKYKKQKNNEIVERKLKPVGIMFSEFYFYLTAYIDDAPVEEFQNPDDTFPTIYRIDRLMEYSVSDEHFRVPYSDRFEEGEFRKRIQFMYGGRLRKIRFKYLGSSLDFILDRLPTAEIVKKEKDGVIIEAEVFGDGVEMWLTMQKENIVYVTR